MSTVPEALTCEPEEAEEKQQLEAAKGRSRKISVSSLHEEKSRRHPLRKSNKTMSVMGDLVAHMHANVSVMAAPGPGHSGGRPACLPEKKHSLSGPSVSFLSLPSASPEATPSICITSSDEQQEEKEKEKSFLGGRFDTINEEARGADSEQSSNSHSVECLADLSEGDAKSDIVAPSQRAQPVARAASYAAGKPSSLRNLEYLISDSPTLSKKPIAQATSSAPLAFTAATPPVDASKTQQLLKTGAAATRAALEASHKAAATSKSTTDLRIANETHTSANAKSVPSTAASTRTHTTAAGNTSSNTLHAIVPPARSLSGASHSSNPQQQPASSQYSSLASRYTVRPVSRPAAALSSAAATSSYTTAGENSSSLSRYRDRFG